MQRIALLASLLGISLLLSYLFLSQPVYISNIQELSTLPENQKLLINGTIKDQRILSSSTFLTLNNGLNITCNCILPSLKSKNISAQVKINRFNSQQTLHLLSYSYAD